MIHFIIFAFSLFLFNLHHFGLNFLLSVFILNKKIKLIQFLTWEGSPCLFASQYCMELACGYFVKVLSSFKGNCLIPQGGAGTVYCPSSWVWTRWDVRPVSPFPVVHNSVVNKFYLMYADCSERCSTTKPQWFSSALFGDQAPNIYVAEPSGLISSYFLNRRKRVVYQLQWILIR